MFPSKPSTEQEAHAAQRGLLRLTPRVALAVWLTRF